MAGMTRPLVLLGALVPVSVLVSLVPVSVPVSLLPVSALVPLLLCYGRRVPWRNLCCPYVAEGYNTSIPLVLISALKSLVQH